MDKIRLGNNIKSLRKAFGETQDDLGFILGVNNNTISQYENGKNIPKDDYLMLIANHYLVSVEELVTGDFSDMEDICADTDLFLKRIYLLFPVFSSETCSSNKDFINALNIQKEMFDKIKNGDLNTYDEIETYMDQCSNIYFDLLDDDICKYHAAANLMGLWHLFLTVVLAPIIIAKTDNAALTKMSKDDIDIFYFVEDVKESFDEASLKDIFPDSEIMSEVTDLKILLKNNKWTNLIDYYIALEYIFGCVNNNRSYVFNLDVGTELMSTFCTLKNKYAIRFLKFCKKLHES